MSEAVNGRPREDVPGHPARERVHAPLAAAVVALEASQTPLSAPLAEVVALAKTALGHLAAICPPRAELVERFLAGSFELDLDGVQAAGWRAERFSASAVAAGVSKVVVDVETLFHSIADSRAAADAAFARFMSDVDALAAVFTEAQADGWLRGDARSDKTLAARARVHLVIRDCASLLN